MVKYNDYISECELEDINDDAIIHTQIIHGMEEVTRIEIASHLSASETRKVVEYFGRQYPFAEIH